MHDYAMMTELFDPTKPWFADYTLRADLGFLGAPKDYCFGCNILLPHKRPRKSKNNPYPTLNESQIKENRALSKTRVAVEQAIGGMKHFYCLTHRIRNHRISIIDQFFGLSAALWNYKAFKNNEL